MAYATQANIEDIFGASNVDAWATHSGDDEAATAARIARSLVVAEDHVNSRLRRGPYAIPFASAPTIIVDATARLAGVWLYECRGVADATNEETSNLLRHKESVDALLADVLSGKMRLDLAKAPGVPKVVK